MTYRDLFFDVDNTLLDFDAAEQAALVKVFAAIHHPLTSEIYQYYQTLNIQLWREYESGRLTKDKLFADRFATVFDHFHLTGDPQRTERLYRQSLSEGHQLMPEADQLLGDLVGHHRLFIVTNGVAATQKRRLTEAGILPLFDGVFISETIGAQKPDRRFFTAVARAVPEFNPNTSLVVGDSLTADVAGANGFGLASAWMNPGHQQNETTTIPTYQIDHLLVLEPIVG